jgi:hypothetical protein
MDRPPPVHLDCADAMSTTKSPEESVLRARTVMEASQRMPAVGLFGGRYGERWYIDLVALPHNAMRRQLFDAYVMVNALAKMAHDVSDADLARVYAWLGSLNLFVTACFDAEEQFLYPLMDQALRRNSTPHPPRLVLLHRMSTKHNILDMLSAARKTRDVATSETRARINALRYALDRFGEAILAYFSLTEGFMPKLFRAGLKNGPKDNSRVERRLFDYLLRQPHGGMLGALLLQCIDSKERRADFLLRNMKKEKERDLFKEHVRTVESRHMHLSTAFDRAAAKYERVFSVQTFMEGSQAHPDASRGLQMLGDIDLNAE